MILHERFKKYRHRVAFQEGERVLTYHDIIQFSQKWSQAIEQDHNKKVLTFIYCHNNIASILGYLASILSNHSCMLINNDLNPSLKNNLIDYYHPDFIWRPSDRIDEPSQLSVDNYKLISTNHQPKIHSDLGLILSTSGSTGCPKAVRLSYTNIISNARSIAKYLGIQKSDVTITTLPMSYSYGLSVINSHLIQGAKLILTNRSVIERDFWDIAQSFKITSLAGVPYTYELFRKLNIFNKHLDQLRYLTQAGGQLDSSLVGYFSENAAEHNIQFYIMYGQTEATARISYLPSHDTASKTDSIGIAIPYGELMLVDSEHNIIESNFTRGELVYRGDNVMMGYCYDYHDLSKDDELAGILTTGDIAYRDDDGYYYLIGRKKRFVKLMGNRINLDEVDRLCAQRGFSTLSGGHDDKLIVTTTDKQQVNEIQAHLCDVLNCHHSVIEIISIDNFLRNDVGKIRLQDTIDYALEHGSRHI